MNAVTIRPAPPPAPDGFEHVAKPAVLWRLAQGAYCQRLTSADPGHWCLDPAAAETYRTYQGVPQWWAYCPRHLGDGLWVEDGQVMRWVLERKAGGAA